MNPDAYICTGVPVQDYNNKLNTCFSYNTGEALTVHCKYQLQCIIDMNCVNIILRQIILLRHCKPKKGSDERTGFAIIAMVHCARILSLNTVTVSSN